jgi:taurine transport system permease protein
MLSKPGSPADPTPDMPRTDVTMSASQSAASRPGRSRDARQRNWLGRIFAKKPAKPGELFGVPGEGGSLAISVVTVAVLFLLWIAITSSGMIKPIFLPGPHAIYEKFVQVSTSGFAGSTLWVHTLISLYRVFGAFALACLTAIPIGIMMGVSRIARGIFDPPIEFYRPLPPLAYLPLVIIWFGMNLSQTAQGAITPVLEVYRPIPPLAYLPLVIIWFGIGEFSKVLLIYLSIFAPLAISARAGVRSASMEQIHAAYSMGASPRQIILHVILKSALPEIFTGMRIGIGVGWTTLVAAEMVASSSGLGFMVLNASEFLASDVVVMGIVVIGFFAFGFDLLMRYIEKVLVPWKGKA